MMQKRVLCLTGFLLAILSPASWGEAARGGGVARLVGLNGSVLADGRRLSPGDSVAAGAVIRTGSGASAKLLLADDTVVDLGPNSSFRIEKVEPGRGADRQVEVSLDLGKARTSIQRKLNRKGKFMIRTKASVLAVRGTEVFLDVARAGSRFRERVTVSEGEVRLNLAGDANRSITLTPGRQFNLMGSVQGDRFLPNPNLAADLGRAVVPVRALAMAGSYRLPDRTLRSQIELPGSGEDRGPAGMGGSTLAVVRSRISPPAETGGAIVPGEMILDIRPEEKGNVAPGGLNQVPGAISAGSTSQPNPGEFGNVTVNVIFDPGS